MKEIIKKPARILSRRTVLLIALAAALAAGTAGFFVLRGPEKNEPAPIRTASEDVTVLESCRLEDIVSVTVTPPEGDPYTLVVLDGALVLEEDPSFPMRETVTDLIASNICAVRSEKTILDSARYTVDLKDFGLDPARCMCTFRKTDGTENTLRIGDRIVGDDIPYYYFMWNDDTRIFSGGTDMYSAFSYDRSLLHPVDRPALHKDLMDRVSVTGANPLSLEMTDLGWQITEPVSYPADLSITDTYLDSIAGILFSRYIGPAEECDLKALGLEEPVLSLKVTEAESILTVPDTAGGEHAFSVPEREVCFDFGTSYDEYSRYVLHEGTVYTAASYLTDFLFRMGPADLRLAAPFDRDINRLAALEAVMPSSETRYEVVLTEQVAPNGSLVTDEDGNILYDCAILKNGEPTDSDAFLIWYNSCLRRIVPTGTAAAAPEGDAEAAVTFTLFAGNSQRTVSFVPAGLQYAMVVDGSCFYSVSAQAVEQLFPLP